MELLKEYSYGKCETCKNCKKEKLGGFMVLLHCSKSGDIKCWNNKCYLYKVKRKYVK